MGEHEDSFTVSAGKLVAFEVALLAMKTGYKASRVSWGPGCFVVRQKGYPDGIAINKNTAEATGIEEGTVCTFRPYLMLYRPDKTFVPYLPCQVDILANDWFVLGKDD